MRMACPHATSVLRWPQLREACASECGCRSRDPRTHTVAEARRADAMARRTFVEAHRAAPAACCTAVQTRRAEARAHHAVHPSCARPSPPSADGSGTPASCSVSRPFARPTAAALHRGCGPRRCRSVDPRPSRHCRGGHGPRAGCGLVSYHWQHPAVCSSDLRRGGHGCGHRGAAHGPCRHGGRGRGSGSGSVHRGACLGIDKFSLSVISRG